MAAETGKYLQTNKKINKNKQQKVALVERICETKPVA